MAVEEPAIQKRGWYSRGYLPHRDDIGLTQFITFRLWDSVPRRLLSMWRDELKHLPTTEREKEEASRISKYIDRGEGECFLRRPEIAKIVEDSLLFFHGQRYDLLSWTVMPNHVHLLVDIYPQTPLDELVHSWKSFTAKACNKELCRSGAFWFREYYDRYIRNEAHYGRVVSYIDFNPVKAGLCLQPSDWRWGSAGRAIPS